MKTLGLSFDFHDSAAALVIDGQLIAAEQEERFSRRKHDSTFPTQSIEYCLAEGGLKAADLDQVVFYEKTFRKFDRIVSSTLASLPESRGYFRDVLTGWLAGDKFDPLGLIAKRLDLPRKRISNVEHHQSHAGAAYFCSGFDEATIVTIDGVGEYETATVSVGRGNKITKLRSQTLPHSIGLFYSAFTAFLGFEVNEGEYKVMGMAGYGEPTRAAEFRKIFDCSGDWGFRLRQDLFNFRCPKDLPYTPKLIEWLGPARTPEAPFMIDGHGDDADVIASSKHYADIAASVQRCTEDVVLDLVERAVRLTGIRRVCMAGGVALNGLANARIQRELGCDLYVHPAAGDSGGAVGAALYYEHAVNGGSRPVALNSALLGRSFNDAQIEAELKRAYIPNVRRVENKDELIRTVVDMLVAGKVVGWFQGRAEWGPRALGCRSILANPQIAEMKQIVNEKIKFREPFRPFAPSILAEKAGEYFDAAPSSSRTRPENFMLSVARVLDHAASRIPATTHVDGTSRLQTVHRDINPLYYDLISAFYERTGVPVILNTSFNLRGEPIVGSPADALKTFSFSGMDGLAIGSFIVEK